MEESDERDCSMVRGPIVTTSNESHNLGSITVRRPLNGAQKGNITRKAHEGVSRNAKGHTRAAKGAVPLGKRLERRLVYILKRWLSG